VNIERFRGNWWTFPPAP